MQNNHLAEEEKLYLLQAAREAMEAGVRGHNLVPPDPYTVPQRLQQLGACFVTLTVGQELRGCIGALEAYQPLIDDVREHAVAAALQDYRFPPVQPNELAAIRIEVSRLTVPLPLDYTTPDDLLNKLCPDIDGVVLKYGIQRATFLPQVWEKIPDRAEFLQHLCYKMGMPADFWRQKHLEVLIYQVEEFREPA